MYTAALLQFPFDFELDFLKERIILMLPKARTVSGKVLISSCFSLLVLLFQSSVCYRSRESLKLLFIYRFSHACANNREFPIFPSRFIVDRKKRSFEPGEKHHDKIETGNRPHLSEDVIRIDYSKT